MLKHAVTIRCLSLFEIDQQGARFFCVYVCMYGLFVACTRATREKHDKDIFLLWPLFGRLLLFVSFLFKEEKDA